MSIGDCRGVLSLSVVSDSDGMIGDRGDSGDIVDLGDRGGMIGDRGESGESGVDSDDDDTGDDNQDGSNSDSDSDDAEPNNILSDQLESKSIPWKYLGVVVVVVLEEIELCGYVE